ncbi:uncharacterized protein, partial [Diadema antillarum]|uniref:uncharacterized protein n=1 Tax=Diadema antillarum TaxID=105358 RepID=UPI003A8C6995
HLKAVLGIECYNCVLTNGVGDPGCADPFNSTSISTVECADGQCLKGITTLNGELSIAVRYCWDTSIFPSCVNDCETLGSQTACVYCCTDDLCNGGGALSARFFAIMAIGAIVAAVSMQSAII